CTAEQDNGQRGDPERGLHGQRVARGGIRVKQRGQRPSLRLILACRLSPFLRSAGASRRESAGAVLAMRASAPREKGIASSIGRLESTSETRTRSISSTVSAFWPENVIAASA